MMTVGELLNRLHRYPQAAEVTVEVEVRLDPWHEDILVGEITTVSFNPVRQQLSIQARPPVDQQAWPFEG